VELWKLIRTTVQTMGVNQDELRLKWETIKQSNISLREHLIRFEQLHSLVRFSNIHTPEHDNFKAKTLIKSVDQRRYQPYLTEHLLRISTDAFTKDLQSDQARLDES